MKLTTAMSPTRYVPPHPYSPEEGQQPVCDAAWDELLANLRKRGDARRPDGQYFQRAPRSKRRRLDDDKTKLKEVDMMEARLRTYLETFFLQEDMVNFDVIQHHKLTKVYPTTAPTKAEQV